MTTTFGVTHSVAVGIRERLMNEIDELFIAATSGKYLTPKEYADGKHYLRWYVVAPPTDPISGFNHRLYKFNFNTTGDYSLTEEGKLFLSQVKGRFTIASNGFGCFELKQDAMIFKLCLY